MRALVGEAEMTKLRAGDWVEVRSKEEILRTLDKNGRLEGMPFMPQMFEHCGKRLQVYKRAHKTCDTINPTAGRRVTEAVHLDTRCDGKAYGGCQASCLIFWKEAWLKPVAPREPSMTSEDQSGVKHDTPDCTELDVWRATHVEGPENPRGKRYTCQATEFPDFVKPLAWWDVRQYVEDYTSGNVSPARFARGLAYLIVWHLALAKRGRVGRPARAFYDWFQRMWGGLPFPNRPGTLPPGQISPRVDLNLQPGELVRIKSFDEIRATFDKSSMNRGLLFGPELVPFCGKTYRVQASVERFIDEKTGYFISLKTPAVILENVWCEARYSNCRMFCPRNIYAWWREIWLERVSESGDEKKACI